MESIAKNSILEFNEDTLQHLRQQYDLDKPGRIDEAINLLEEWIKKQEHFQKKDFSRDYLERTLVVFSKGSVERAKTKLDKLCTFRTKQPSFFGVHDVKKFSLLQFMHAAFLPKLTNDHYRTFLIRNRIKSFNGNILEVYQYTFMQFEYVQAYDYCSGLVLVIDFSEADIMETMKFMNPIEIKQGFALIKEGYGMRIKQIHLISPSKAIETIVSLFKQVLSAKLGSRINVHRTFSTLYEYVPKEILPKDYGGQEKTLLELHTQFQDILTSEEFTAYLVEMNKARTDEKLRIKSDNDEDLGIPGSFRKLTVD